MDIVEDVVLRFRTEGVEKLRAGQTAVTGVKTEATGATSSVSQLGGAVRVMGIAMAAAAAAGVAVMIKSQINLGDEMQKLGIRTGATTEFLSVMKREAELGGAAIGDVANGMRSFARVLNNAEAGLSTSARAFTQVGLSIDEISKMNPEDQFISIAKAIAGMEDPTKKAAAAQELLGRGGLALIPMMDGLATKGYGKAREEAEKFGIVIAQDFADQSAQFNDNVQKMKDLLAGMAIDIANDVVPSINQLFGSFQQLREDNDSLISKIPTLGEVFKGIASVAIGIAGVIKGAWDLVGQSIAGVAAGILLAAQGEFKQAWAAVKSGASDGLDALKIDLAAIGIAVQDLWNPKSSGPSGAQGGGGEAPAAVVAITNEIGKQIDLAAKMTAEYAEQLALLKQTDPVQRELLSIEFERAKALAKVSEDLKDLPESTRVAINTVIGQIFDIRRFNVQSKAISESLSSAIESGWKGGFRKVELDPQILADIKEGLARVIDKISPDLVRGIEQSLAGIGHGVRNALQNALRGASSIEDVFKDFTQTIVDGLGAQLDDMIAGWMAKLEKSLGIVRDTEGNIVSSGRGGRIALAGFQGVAAGYNLYQQGQAGVSREDNALSGALSGASIGAQFTWVGAVIGAIVGGAIGYFTGSDKLPDQKGFLSRSPMKGGFFLDQNFTQNLTEAEQQGIISQATKQWDSVKNAYIGILLALPTSIVSSISDSISAPMFDKEFVKHIGDWINNTLPRELAAQLEPALQESFVASGMAREQFKRFWDQTQLMDQKDAVEFWMNMAQGIAAFQRATDRVKAAQNLPDDLSSILLDYAGRPIQNVDDFNGFPIASDRVPSGFVMQVQEAGAAIFDMARNLVNLSGPEQARVWAQIAGSVEAVTQSLSDFISRVAQIARQLKETFRGARFEHDLSRIEDPDAQRDFLFRELARVRSLIANAAQLGLSPEQIQGLSGEALALLNRIYEIDPSQAASDWWHKQLNSLENLTNDALQSVLTQAVDEVQSLLDSLQPFKDYMLGIPIDLEDVMGMVRDKFDGLGDALDDLIRRLNEMAQPDDTTPEGGGPGTGGPNPGGNGATINLNFNGPVYGIEDLDNQIRSTVRGVARDYPYLFQSRLN